MQVMAFRLLVISGCLSLSYLVMSVFNIYKYTYSQPSNGYGISTEEIQYLRAAYFFGSVYMVANLVISMLSFIGLLQNIQILLQFWMINESMTLAMSAGFIILQIDSLVRSGFSWADLVLLSAIIIKTCAHIGHLICVAHVYREMKLKSYESNVKFMFRKNGAFIALLPPKKFIE